MPGRASGAPELLWEADAELAQDPVYVDENGAVMPRAEFLAQLNLCRKVFQEISKSLHTPRASRETLPP